VTSLLGVGAGEQGAEWQDLTMLDSDPQEYTDYDLEVSFGRGGCVWGEDAVAHGKGQEWWPLWPLWPS
jgi:hypothetical protein